MRFATCIGLCGSGAGKRISLVNVRINTNKQITLQFKIAAPCVYTPEQIESAQRNPSILDDFAGLEDNVLVDTAADTSASKQALDRKDGSYLLEIPAIDLNMPPFAVHLSRESTSACVRERRFFLKPRSPMKSGTFV